MKESVWTRREAETRAYAAQCLRRFPGVRVIALRGELGSGKTAFVKGVAEAMGITGPVTSPTFALIQEYPAKDGLCLVHADLYRLEDPSELLRLGWDDYLDDPNVRLVIEWAERAAFLLPRDTLWITLEFGDEPCDRRISVEQGGDPQ